jgi:prevent-host-death family protein
MVGLDPTTQLLDTSKANMHIKQMRATSYNDFRRNLEGNFDKVNDDFEPVIITRSNGKPTAVLISLDHYESLNRKLVRSFPAAVAQSE